MKTPTEQRIAEIKWEMENFSKKDNFHRLPDVEWLLSELERTREALSVARIAIWEHLRPGEIRKINHRIDEILKGKE